MKTINFLPHYIFSCIIMMNFSNCASSNGLEQDLPSEIGDVYFQHWTAGVQGGGAGIDLYIPLNSELSNEIMLDSVYFKDMVVKLEKTSGDQTVYIGHFKLDQNTNDDLIISSNPAEEFKNKLPRLKVKPPIEISENDCLVSYSFNGEIKYFRITDIEEKDSMKYPRARKN